MSHGPPGVARRPRWCSSRGCRCAACRASGSGPGARPTTSWPASTAGPRRRRSRRRRSSLQYLHDRFASACRRPARHEVARPARAGLRRRRSSGGRASAAEESVRRRASVGGVARASSAARRGPRPRAAPWPAGRGWAAAPRLARRAGGALDAGQRPAGRAASRRRSRAQQVRVAGQPVRPCPRAESPEHRDLGTARPRRRAISSVAQGRQPGASSAQCPTLAAAATAKAADRRGVEGAAAQLSLLAAAVRARGTASTSRRASSAPTPTRAADLVPGHGQQVQRRRRRSPPAAARRPARRRCGPGSRARGRRQRSPRPAGRCPPRCWPT